MEQMKIYDNFLGAAKQQQVFKDCHDLVYKMGETDRPDCPPTGMVSQLAVSYTHLTLPTICSV